MGLYRIIEETVPFWGKLDKKVKDTISSFFHHPEQIEYLKELEKKLFEEKDVIKVWFDSFEGNFSFQEDCAVKIGINVHIDSKDEDDFYEKVDKIIDFEAGQKYLGYCDGVYDTDNVKCELRKELFFREGLSLEIYFSTELEDQ
jgi:molybdopterin converting factor small subunit